MQTYEFVVHTTDPIDEQLVDRIYGACDDATASSNEAGLLEVAFDRQAETLDVALRGALQQLRSLGCKIDSVTIEHDAIASIV